MRKKINKIFYYLFIPQKRKQKKKFGVTTNIASGCDQSNRFFGIFEEPLAMLPFIS